MSLFDFFKKNHPANTNILNNNSNGNANGFMPEIPKELFIEEAKPNGIYTGMNSQNKSLNDVYLYLQTDFDEKGYRDALINPESTNMEENINLIKLDLFLLIEQVTTNYEDKNCELENHIESRSRAGLIDTVEELKSLKQTIGSHLEKLAVIKKEAETNSGSFSRLKLSYQKGFKRGFVALSHHRFLSNGKIEF